ncbi:MAG TPA: vanadium-dependent haloperoxidase [Blastocatellia bacterium]|nr:vanadium-dependent haloperoxidase [Blastocatellia bacterium]
MKNNREIEMPTEQEPLDSPDSECEQQSHKQSDPASPSSKGRRRFLGQVGLGVAATIATGTTASAQSPFQTNKCDDFNFPFGVEPRNFAANRFVKSYNCRLAAAKLARSRKLINHIDNGDDDLYPNKIGSHTKALPHNQLGEVNQAAYETLARARTTQDPDDFEKIQLGLGRKLTSPQAGLAMDLEGPDSHHVTMPPAPRLASAEAAGEAVELYWMALLRDVNFTDYGTDPGIARAAQDLSTMSDFRGPKQGGTVTPDTIFRLDIAGDLSGPWMSQFLLQDFFFGANFFSQKMRTVSAANDYMTKYADWLDVQNGADPAANIQYDPTPRYIRNLRDMAEWVHIDALYQAYLHACLIMLGQGVPIDPGLPLYNAKVQAGFAQCGGPHILSFVTEVATRALKAVWYQKWFVHHRLRPEEYGGRVHNHLSKTAQYPLHPDVLKSKAVAETFQKYGTYLLPQAFAEGSPTHSSYGSGHATVAGACVTVLKAFFDETAIVKNPVVPNADGTALVPYVGPPLTVLGELNKVARNVAFGRNGAGIHWRTDALEGMKLGEAVSIGIIEEQKLTYNDKVEMSLTKFDGTKITI